MSSESNKDKSASPSERRKPFGESAHQYAVNRLRALQLRQDIEGDNMLPGWRREMEYHAFVKKLIEWVDEQELEKAAAAAKGRRR